jgi:chemotaxis protein methyltransferase CheR
MRDLIGDPASAIEAQIGDADYQRLADYFYRRTGIRLDDKRRDVTIKRVARCAAEAGAENFRGYFSTLRFEASQTELQRLINALTVNETYFFREDYQLRALTGPILSEVVAARRDKRPVRIWSAPCATGEEPYSIALSLLENWPPIASVDVELAASDIDTDALAAAQAGIYGARSVQNVPPAMLRRHFEALPGERWRISEAIRGCVSLSHLSICDPDPRSRVGEMDVIFCRNVLIYFDDASRQTALEGFHDTLRPGGFLMLGYSETLGRGSALFRVRRFADAIVYQKPKEGEAP